MQYKIFLDDIRSPTNIGLIGEWTIIRNYNEFIDIITKNGLPTFITFDHDLSFEHYIQTFDYSKFKEKTGYDCLLFLIEYCIKNNKMLPECKIHSMNPVGKQNMISLLKQYENLNKPSLI